MTLESRGIDLPYNKGEMSVKGVSGSRRCLGAKDLTLDPKPINIITNEAASHMRLKALDHCILRSLIG